MSTLTQRPKCALVQAGPSPKSDPQGQARAASPYRTRGLCSLGPSMTLSPSWLCHAVSLMSCTLCDSQAVTPSCGLVPASCGLRGPNDQGHFPRARLQGAWGVPSAASGATWGGAWGHTSTFCPSAPVHTLDTEACHSRAPWTCRREMSTPSCAHQVCRVASTPWGPPGADQAAPAPFSRCRLRPGRGEAGRGAGT